MINDGFSVSMYDIARNVTIPAIISTLRDEPLALTLKLLKFLLHNTFYDLFKQYF